MYEELNTIGIKADEQKKQLLASFCSLFTEYNSKINLISNNDINFLYEKHIFDSLAFNLFHEKYKSGQKYKIMDIGTGGGFPSLPISICFNDLEIVAVDSINKKINFIKYAADTLKLKNIIPICTRIEDLQLNYKNNIDVVVTRAMAELRIVLEYAIPYVKKQGYFVVYKSIKAEDEIKNAGNALKTLKSEIIDIIDYKLPLKEDIKRVLIVVRKNSDTGEFYPRKNGIIKKKPL